MSDDICERLVRFSKHKQCMSTDLEVEAADEITRLREENARLRDIVCKYLEGSMREKDIRAAAAAIREGGK